MEVQRVWEVYDDRLQFSSRQDALLLDEALRDDDVSSAWLVWSGAAEAALADAYQFAGGSCPGWGPVQTVVSHRWRKLAHFAAFFDFLVALDDQQFLVVEDREVLESPGV